MVWNLRQLCEKDIPMTCINNKWVPSRPINWTVRTLWQRLYEAWLVYKGKAEAFTWPEGQ